MTDSRSHKMPVTRWAEKNMNSTANGIQDEAVTNLQEAYKPGGVSNVTASFYSSWAENDNYEKHLNKDLYKGPSIAAQGVSDCYQNQEKTAAKILDFAAGTGFVAECLKHHGFKNVDALDPSEGMLKKARDKGVYNNIVCAYLDDKKLPILEDTYDCAVSSGGMGEGHIPAYGLDQLIRVVKPGGYIVIVMREEYLKHSQYEDTLEPYMENLVLKGHWEKVSRAVVPNYCLQHNGVIFKYRVTNGKYKN